MQMLNLNDVANCERVTLLLLLSFDYKMQFRTYMDFMYRSNSVVVAETDENKFRTLLLSDGHHTLTWTR